MAAAVYIQLPLFRAPIIDLEHNNNIWYIIDSI